MEILAYLLIIVGGIIAFIGGIWLLVECFKVHILWGLGAIFVPFVSLVFIIMYWSVAKMPFLIGLLGSIIYLIG